MKTKKEFLDKYGDVYVVFSHYYKYTFTYTATMDDGSVVEVSVGGDDDSIYRFEVSADTPMRVSELDPTSGQVTRMGTTLAEFYDY